MPLVNQLTKIRDRQQTRPVLVVEDPQGKRIINLDKNIYSIGRELKNSIVIHSQLVSRHHATLVRVNNSETKTEVFQIIDGNLQGERSTNGLIINGKHCLSHTLQHRDTISFGGKAQASYLLIDCELSETEILEYCESGNLRSGETVGLDPFDTLVTSNSEVEPLSEAALLRLASFPEVLPSPIIEIDLDGEITYLNPAAILQFPRIQEADLHHPILAGLVEAVNNEKKLFFVREVEVETAIFEQSVHYIAESRLIRSYLVDISDRKRVEKEREQLLLSEQAARRDAEAANRMKDEFLATLSHELRTPLNSLVGWAQMLRTRKFDETTTARALETIERNSKSLAQLIEDVLDVSRIIMGKLHLNVRPIELAPAIAAAIDTVRPAAEAKEIEISSVLDREVGLILGDSNRLQQVIWNLLSNAVKFTPKGGRVEVRLSLVNSHAQIQVSDTGMGIAAEFLPYVFERFRQADSSSTRAHGGLGLGLAIVRHLVELQGGTVAAQSAGVGQGATFTVKLPIPATSRVERETRREGSERLSALTPLLGEDLIAPAHPRLLEGLRILVVDDEADARELSIAILEQYGATALAVATAGDAIVALALEKPNVLVSDIGMPGEDGYALIRKIRALDAEQGGRIPAVALTAYARADDRTQAILAGFQMHVPKPVNPAELAAVVANLAGRTGKV